MNTRVLQTFGMFAAVGLAVAIMLQMRPGQCSTASAAQAVSAGSHDAVQFATLAFAQQNPQAAAPSRAAAPRGMRSAPPETAQEGDARSRRSGQELIERCLEVAREIDPELGKQLISKRQQNPQEFEQMMWQGEVGRGLISMAQLKQRDPDLYQAKISEVAHSLQINRVASQLQEAMLSADQGRVRSLQSQLKNLLQIQLALSLKSRGEYLCRIEEQVQQLRKEIEHDAANFHAIIDARMQQLLSQPVPNDPAAVIPAASRPGDEPSRQRR